MHPPSSLRKPRVSGTTSNRAFLRAFPATQFPDSGLCGRSRILVAAFGALSLHPEIPFPEAVVEREVGPYYVQIGRCRREIADSLRRIFEIFPFLGDRDRRPGFDRHCVAGQENGGQPDLQDIRYGSFGGAGNFTTVPVPIGARNFVDRTPRCHKGA